MTAHGRLGIKNQLAEQDRDSMPGFDACMGEPQSLTRGRSGHQQVTIKQSVGNWLGNRVDVADQWYNDQYPLFPIKDLS